MDSIDSVRTVLNDNDVDNGDVDDDDEIEDNGQMLLVEYRLRWALHYSVTGNPAATTTMLL